MQRRILIADDHSLMRSTLKEALEGHPGWQVCAEAKDGLEAVQEAVELMPDIAILDFTMPTMDGLRAARKILSAAPAVPILLYTNHASSTLVIEAAKAGVRLVVSKSVPVDELISAVESVLGGEVVTPIGAVTASAGGTTSDAAERPGASTSRAADAASVPSDAPTAEALPDTKLAPAANDALARGAGTVSPPSAVADGPSSRATGHADRRPTPPDAASPPDATRKRKPRRRPRAAAATNGLK